MVYFQFGPALGYVLGEAQIQPGKNLKNSAVLLECLNLLNRKVIYTTIGIVRCTLGVATDYLAVKPYIPHKSFLQ